MKPMVLIRKLPQIRVQDENCQEFKLRYLQDRNTDAVVENGLGDTREEAEMNLRSLTC